MNRIFRDALDVDRHQTFKRLERRAQWAAWKRRSDALEAPPLPCLWRLKPEDFPIARPAHLLALFEGDMALVRFNDGMVEFNGMNLLRSGILWEQWHPWILRAYLRGAPVPKPFIPLRRIPPGWVEEALNRSAHLQKEFFEKLREAKLLPSLPKLEATTISTWMRWEDLRANFLDFKEGAKDNPRIG